MQPLVLAVQNSLELRDMGAGTATATFFRSLGGSVGVAALGAVLTNKLASELPPLLQNAFGRLSPEQQSRFGSVLRSGVSINDPATIRGYPQPVRIAIESGFTHTLHPIFLAAGLVSLIAVVLCLALPNRVLRGAGPEGSKPGVGGGHEAGVHEPKPVLDDEDEELAAAEMEAKATTLY